MDTNTDISEELPTEGVITTEGTTEDPLETEHRSGESVQCWVRRHCAEVRACTPDDDTLTTEWPTTEGVVSVDTERNEGESDSLFKERHITECLLEMTDHPPVP